MIEKSLKQKWHQITDCIWSMPFWLKAWSIDQKFSHPPATWEIAMVWSSVTMSPTYVISPIWAWSVTNEFCHLTDILGYSVAHPVLRVWRRSGRSDHDRWGLHLLDAVDVRWSLMWRCVQHEGFVGDQVDLDNDPPMVAVLSIHRNLDLISYIIYVCRSGLLNHIDSAFLPMTLYKQVR